MKKSKYKLKKDLVVQQVNEEVFIFDGETSILHTLNETAADLFKQLKKGATFSDLVKYLVDEYEINQEKALKDTKEFVDKLMKKKLLIEKKPTKSSHA
ncbi:PqqD family protein [Candidatus Roizmanbacteria bacterium]|nr:MAG: PqqD family protein [Candidatus Roizmanbacteria bacterium]